MDKRYRGRPKIVITMGDPGGIGPEIISSALRRVKAPESLIVVGDRGVFDRVNGKRARLKAEFIDLANVAPKRFSFGKVTAEYGRASIEYLDAAMDLILDGAAEAVVTCPISKEAIHKAGFSYSGHTEYFGEKACVDDEVMMLVNDCFKFSLVTRHIPLSGVAGAIDPAYMEHVIRVTHDALRRFFGIKRPRMVVCGINPHGSDNGVIGNDENTVIKPVVRRLSRRFPGLTGPLGADAAISKAYGRMFDAVIAMYHDQALIPLKLTGDETGVNMTLGLGFVRTSPLHGTAFDIAGTGKADPASLLAAINLAHRCVLNQKKV